MPVSEFLNPNQKKSLQKALRSVEDPHQRQRILMVLLRNDGKTYEEIVGFIGCSYRSVAHWCIHGDPDDLESFKDGRAQGNYRKATPEYIAELLRVIEQEPIAFGYEFGRWTTSRLATHLRMTTEIQMSSVQVGRILKQKKYRYRWAKYSLEEKQNPEQRLAFKHQLEEELTRSMSNPEGFQVWFWDESGFSLRVIRRKQWGPKGERKTLSGKRSRGQVNLMGGLRYSDRKQKCYVIDQGNGESFQTNLVKLNEFVCQEWVENGNIASEFVEKGPRILIVLDNASYHKKQTVIDQLALEFPNLELFFLPPYSPDYNLIELVWHSCKEFIAHRVFTSIDELRDLLDRLTNQGELDIKWNRNVENKGNVVLAN